jgi:N-acetylneuraminate lyase
MTPSFHGVWPALVTPADDAGEVNFEALVALVEHTLNKQVDGLYLCGSTGEGLLLSLDERRRVLEAVLKEVRRRVPVIVHVGCVSTRDAVALARHACDAGADGVSSVLPLLDQSAEAVRLHYGAIAAAAPGLPFYPYMFGGQVNALALMSDLLARIPNLAGGKYTGPNMFELGQLIRLRAGGWTLFSGMDEQCLFAAMVGAPGNIGSTLNVMPGAYRELRRLHAAGQLQSARDLQLRINRVTEVLITYGFWGALREALRLLGIDCGEPRRPYPPMPPSRRAQFRAALEEVDFLALAAM